MSTPEGIALKEPLALFPLRLVLFPGGRLDLRIFEARYLDLISACLRQQRAFGVVCLREGDEVAHPAAANIAFETLGTLAHLNLVDADSPGLLQVSCLGGSRFAFSRAHQQPDGLWLADDVVLLPDDEPVPPDARFAAATEALAQTLALLALRSTEDHLPERHLDEAGWVANRWAELLPASLAERQQWLALMDPQARLAAVSERLQAQGVG